jgi:hypothetical protein
MLALVLAAASALPLLAGEKTPEVTISQPPPPSADSPLVAAAKRAKRLGKKPGYVITNATLVTSGSHAHVTTSATTPAPLNLPAPTNAEPKSEGFTPPPPPPSKPSGDPKKKLERAAAAYEMDGPYGDDPAQMEHHLEELSKEQQAKPPKPQP